MGCCCGKEKGDKKRRRKRDQRGEQDQQDLQDQQNCGQSGISGIDSQLQESRKFDVYVSKFRYEPGSPAEVPLEKGDRVELLSKEPAGFVFIRQLKMHGTRGYVPAEYLKLEGDRKDDGVPPPRRELPADMQETWREIPREQLQMTKVLGAGRFGLAHLAVWNIPGENPLPVVLKHLKELSLTDKQALLNEASLMKDLRHENIVKLIGVVSASEPYYIVTEFVKNGSLQDYLKERRKLRLSPLSSPSLIDICLQICRGMKYLAGKKLVHRDLAARNVLIDVQSESPFSCAIKISDFGLARTLNKEYVYQMKHETYIATRWLAPEGFDTMFSSETDVWAFGITMAEIFRGGEDPWGTIEDAEVRTRILAGRSPDRPRNMPHDVGAIMKRCCQLDKKVRPTFAQLVVEFEKLRKSTSLRK